MKLNYLVLPNFKTSEIPEKDIVFFEFLQRKGVDIKLFKLGNQIKTSRVTTLGIINEKEFDFRALTCVKGFTGIYDIRGLDYNLIISHPFMVSFNPIKPYEFQGEHLGVNGKYRFGFGFPEEDTRDYRRDRFYVKDVKTEEEMYKFFQAFNNLVSGKGPTFPLHLSLRGSYEFVKSQYQLEHIICQVDSR